MDCPRNILHACSSCFIAHCIADELILWSANFFPVHEFTTVSEGRYVAVAAQKELNKLLNASYAVQGLELSIFWSIANGPLEKDLSGDVILIKSESN